MKLILLVILSLTLCMPGTPNRPSIILICDDDKPDLALQKHHLAKYDCVVIECLSSSEALRLLALNWYDYAFIDVYLDFMTGLDVVRLAKPKNPLVEFYLVSGRWTGKMLLEAAQLSEDLGGRVRPIIKNAAHSEKMATFADALKWLSLRERKY